MYFGLYDCPVILLLFRQPFFPVLPQFGSGLSQDNLLGGWKPFMSSHKQCRWTEGNWLSLMSGPPTEKLPCWKGCSTIYARTQENHYHQHCHCLNGCLPGECGLPVYHLVFFLHITSPRYGCIILRWAFLCVCLFVSACIAQKTQSKLHKNFVYHAIQAMAQSSIMTVEYVIYLWFCGWHHVFLCGVWHWQCVREHGEISSV